MEQQFYRLLEDKYRFRRIDLIGGFKSLSPDILNQFQADLNLVVKGEPLQYLIGKVQFADRTILVNSAVLIPRPETEELVHLIESRIPEFKKGIDLATGSGCIALALCKEGREISALEKSKAALELAKKNAQINELDLNFIADDILKPKEPWPHGLDLIVSNPPYVRLSEKEAMSASVYAKEPQMALFVDDKDPLVFYKAISRYAQHTLKGGGVLALEINQYLGQETQSLVQEYLSKVELLNDQFGNPRFIWARK